MTDITDTVAKVRIIYYDSDPVVGKANEQTWAHDQTHEGKHRLSALTQTLGEGTYDFVRYENLRGPESVESELAILAQTGELADVYVFNLQSDEDTQAADVVLEAYQGMADEEYELRAPRFVLIGTVNTIRDARALITQSHAAYMDAPEPEFHSMQGSTTGLARRFNRKDFLERRMPGPDTSRECKPLLDAAKTAYDEKNPAA